MTLVLLDTDIGSDIDDAASLAYLLAEPRCELAGITTVTGDTQKRAALADVLCRIAGRDEVPIHAGLTGPLLDGPGQPEVPQAEVLERYDHRERFPDDAVDFIRRTVRARPHEVTLLSIGPLTNVGAAFAADPALPSLLRAHVAMAGCYFSPKAEWNVRCDPFGAALAFRARPPVAQLVGLDVTLRCRMPADDVRAKFSTPLLQAVASMAEVWFRESPDICFHDPLAAVTIFEPDVCTWTRGIVDVELAGGRTPFAADGAQHVATEVDVPRFFDAYFVAR